MKLTSSDNYNLFQKDYWFGVVDTRPLSVFRIFFAALLILKDAIYHLWLSHHFYSDDGLVPLAVVNTLGRSNRFSIMDAMPYYWMAQAFFLFWLVVALALLVGYRTKLMTVLNFLIVLSIHERNIYVLNGADTVIRVLSFWMIFVPTGDYYSLDALRKRLKRYQSTRLITDLRASTLPHRSYALPIRIFQLQIGIIYLFTALFKLSGSMWTSGQGVFYALQLRSLTLPSGDWVVATFPNWSLMTASYYVLVVEVLFFILVFFPFFQPILRVVGLSLGTLLHVGIGILMSIPNFSIVMLVSYLSFFEARWIEKIDRRLRTGRIDDGPVLVKALNRRSPAWVFLLLTSEIEIALVTSEPFQLPGSHRFTIIDEKRIQLSECAAFRRSSQQLLLSRLWFWLLKSDFLCKVFFRTAALWSSSLPIPFSSCCEDPQMSAPEGVVANRMRRIVGKSILTAFLLTMMLSIIWWNLHTIRLQEESIVRAPPISLQTLVQFSGTWQQWNMFAPDVSNIDGWITIPGKFEDQSSLDLFTGNPINNEAIRWYWGPDSRWKKYVENIRREREDALLLYWGKFYCRLYNDIGNLPEGRRLATLEIQYLFRRSPAPTEPQPAYRNQTLWRHWCFPEYQHN